MQTIDKHKIVLLYISITQAVYVYKNDYYDTKLLLLICKAWKRLAKWEQLTSKLYENIPQHTFA